MSHAPIRRRAGALAAAVAALCLAPAPAAHAQRVDAEAIGAACLEGIGLDSPMNRVPLEQRRRILACMGRELAGQINPQLPIRLPDGSTFVSVAADGLTMTYTYRLELDAAQFSDTDRAKVDAGIRARVCGQRALADGIASGGVNVTVLTNRSGQRLHEVRVDRC